ncbi:hypothetical protein ACFO0S_09810 [Chryseomicrobium palamuruense]|uniref:DUF7666 domain-containing protein n=1 Tax=Chryseomicrobium palamuruense TaxID=682973 RepID=A0ABV8UVJ1_9BACL
MTEAVKGYKVFNSDWTCRNFQYEVGGIFENDCPPIICEEGFHFCKRAVDCFNYYPFNPENKVAEVLALGHLDEDGDKSCTNKIQIVREIPWGELLELVNLGKGNSGHSNSGHSNSGHSNSGNRNSGHSNSGNRNSGHSNSGHSNSGHSNSGHSNSGHSNSGNRNSGDWNSGHSNSGHSNSGDWNKASNVAGCFNTEQHQLLFFDKPTDMTFDQWRSSDAYYLLNQIDFRPTEWVSEYSMTDDEKNLHPEYKVTGGYLKIRNNDNVAVEWWNELSEIRRNIIKNIPNFDADKFYLITGIKVN